MTIAKCNVILLLAVVAALGLSHADAAVEPRKVTYEVNIDNIIDKNLPAIRGIFWELDPTELDDVKIPVVPGTYMQLHTGWLQNLSLLKRTGKCMLKYTQKVMTVDLDFGWDDLAFDYRYLLRIVLASRKGDFHGELVKCRIHIVLEINFNSYQISLKKMDFTDTGKVKLSIEGHILDWIYNKIIKLGTSLAKNLVLKTVEDKGKQMIMRRIDEINIKLGEILVGHNQEQATLPRAFTFVDLTKPHVYTSQ